MNAAPRITLADAKAKLDVATLWQVLGLPGKPGRSCRCPLHEDSKASFSVFVSQKGSLRWKCHSQCGQGGPVELIAQVFDITEREACRRIIELAGGNEARDLPPRRYPMPTPPKRRGLLLPVGTRQGDRADLRAVAELRQLSFAGVELASARGLLWFASPRGCPAWIITDRARVNAQARKVDGRRWTHLPTDDVKAWTLPGSRAPWPIGVREAADFPFVVVVEGGPDLLAAHHFIVEEQREKDVAAVAILGGANIIPEDALELLAGKRVRLFPHADAPGRETAVRWAAQLEAVKCTVDAFNFEGLRRADGVAVDDLNDFADLDPACREAEAADLERILPE